MRNPRIRRIRYQAQMWVIHLESARDEEFNELWVRFEHWLRKGPEYKHAYARCVNTWTELDRVTGLCLGMATHPPVDMEELLQMPANT